LRRKEIQAPLGGAGPREISDFTWKPALKKKRIGRKPALKEKEPACIAGKVKRSSLLKVLSMSTGIDELIESKKKNLDRTEINALTKKAKLK